MDEIRKLITESEIIQIYERFLRNTLVPVFSFSNDQIFVINEFLTFKGIKIFLKHNEVDMMEQFVVFETMRRFMM